MIPQPDPTLVQWKDPKRFPGEWQQLNARLRAVVLYAAAFSRSAYGMPVVVTCMFRTPAENKALYGDDRPSVHGSWRGCDLRCTGGAFPTTYGPDLEAAVNEVYSYGAGKTVALLEGAVGLRVPHVHLQVPASTPGHGRWV